MSVDGSSVHSVHGSWSHGTCMHLLLIIIVVHRQLWSKFFQASVVET